MSKSQDPRAALDAHEIFSAMVKHLAQEYPYPRDSAHCVWALEHYKVDFGKQSGFLKILSELLGCSYGKLIKNGILMELDNRD